MVTQKKKGRENYQLATQGFPSIPFLKIDRDSPLRSALLLFSSLQRMGAFGVLSIRCWDGCKQDLCPKLHVTHQLMPLFFILIVVYLCHYDLFSLLSICIHSTKLPFSVLHLLALPLLKLLLTTTRRSRPSLPFSRSSRTRSAASNPLPRSFGASSCPSPPPVPLRLTILR